MRSRTRSCVLEVRVEDVWPPATHLRALNVSDARIELCLVPLALLELVIPLHALLCSHLRLLLKLVRVETAKLFNLEVLAGILWGIFVHLLREVRNGHMDVICSLCGLVSLWNVEAMVVGDRALPIG